MSQDLFFIAEVDSGAVSRTNTVANAAIDFDTRLWHAGIDSRFVPWTFDMDLSGLSASCVQEIDSDGQIGEVVPHQWEGGHLYWIVPGETPAHTHRSFRIAFDSNPGPPPGKNNFTDRVVLTDLGREILFSFNEQELCRYNYREVFKPFFYPVNGPDGSVVRGIIQDGEGHHFHHGIWVGYGSMDRNGTDLWCESDEIRPRRGPTGRMVHESFERYTFGRIYGIFRERLAYQKSDGYVFTREWRTVRVSRPSRETLAIDFEITLQEPEDTGPRNMMFSCRVAQSMRIVDASTREKARMEKPGKLEKTTHWADFSGPVGSGWNGVAIFEHPSNLDFPRSPSGAEYGLMSIGRTYPTSDEYRGGTVTYRYRAYVHNHDAQTANVQQAWEDYAYPCLVTLGKTQKV